MIGRSTRCSRSDPSRSGRAFAAPRSRRRARLGARPNDPRARRVVCECRSSRGTSSARATSGRAGDPTPRFRCRYREKNPKFAREALRERRTATAARGECARVPENTTPLSRPRSIDRVPRCSSRSDSAWSARSGHGPRVTSAECSRVAGIFNGGIARDAPWRRRSGARRARGRGGRGDRRRRWQTS